MLDENETYETFEDLDEDDTFSEEVDEQQSATSMGEGDDEDEDEEEENDEHPKAKREARSKKEEKKKARGQKGDDLDSLDIETEEFEDEDEEEEEEEAPKKEKEEKEEVVEEKKQTEEEKKAGKIKPTYVTVDGETYSLDSNSLVATKVDGKIEKVTLQELKNNYAGKVTYDTKMNEINLKEINFKRQEQDFIQEKNMYAGVKQKIEGIIKDPMQNPKDAYKIFLDSIGVDSYDLMERSFKADLTELANVLNMEPAERKAYFLEKKNGHLLEQSKKREELSQNAERVRSYQHKTDALRKSYGVSEAQYVDALEELRHYGTDEKDISERDIVEWAATKPHRAEVKNLLDPYMDQFDEDAYGELSWKLANILRSGSESPQTIKKHLAEVYGVPTEVKQLAKKLNPLGRKSKPLNKPSPKNNKYETFDDLDDE